MFTSSCFCKSCFYMRSFSVINSLCTPSSAVQINFGNAADWHRKFCYDKYARRYIMIYIVNRNMYQISISNFKIVSIWKFYVYAFFCKATDGFLRMLYENDHFNQFLDESVREVVIWLELELHYADRKMKSVIRWPFRPLYINSRLWHISEGTFYLKHTLKFLNTLIFTS